MDELDLKCGLVWSVDSICVISFRKIFGLCGLKGHIVVIRWDVALEDGRTEREDRARILKQNSQYFVKTGGK